MLLLFGLIFLCAVWKATAFTAVSVTILRTNFHFPFSPVMHLSMSSETNDQKSRQLWLRRVLDATGSFPEEMYVKVSPARHADGLRHALPASQKIWNLNEGNAGLPSAPASPRDVDGVSQWWVALAASSPQSLARSPSQKEKLKPWSCTSPECQGGQGRMTFSSGLRSNSLAGLSCFEEEAYPSPGVPSLPNFTLTWKRSNSYTAW